MFWHTCAKEYCLQLCTRTTYTWLTDPNGWVHSQCNCHTLHNCLSSCEPSHAITCKMIHSIIKICQTYSSCIFHKYLWHGMFVMSENSFGRDELMILSNEWAFESNPLCCSLYKFFREIHILFCKCKEWFKKCTKSTEKNCETYYTASH